MAIRGFVEALAEHEVRGWPFDEDDPDRHVPVVAYLDGTPIGDAVADTLRPDLLAEGIGKGDHEFRISFARPIRPFDLGRLDIQAGRELAVSLRSFREATTLVRTPPPTRPFPSPTRTNIPFSSSGRPDPGPVRLPWLYSRPDGTKVTARAT